MMKHILRKPKCLTWILVVSVVIITAVSLFLTPAIIKAHVNVEPTQIANVPVTNSISERSDAGEVPKANTVSISELIREVEDTGNKGTDKQVIGNAANIYSSNMQVEEAIVVHKDSSNYTDVLKTIDKAMHQSSINKMNAIRIPQPVNETEITIKTSKLSGYSKKHCRKPKVEYRFKQKSNYAISIYNTKIKSLRYEEQKYKKRVVIMTPISNNAGQLLSYFQLICSLSYPHQLISLVLGEDSSRDRTFEEALKLSHEFASDFSSIKVYHFNIKMTNKFKVERHVQQFQLTRRSHLAKARNNILKKGLLPEHDYVLWIDSDVASVPQDIIQHLMYDDKDVIVPVCLWKHGNEYESYDKNIWQETDKSIKFLRNVSSNKLMLEGYTRSLRRYLPDIKNQGLVVKLDGVGGCVLMVKAQCFRKGLKFPETIYENHIETEGMAKMARRMNFGVYGLPFVNVVHS